MDDLLAVHLSSDPSTAGSGSRNSDSSLTGSDGGSQISPASSHEAESNTSSISQSSPPHGTLGVLGIGNGSEANGDSREGSINGDIRYRKRTSDSERYIERRRRNNEAAKRCRANRRALFEYRFKRAQELEQENVHLKEEMQRLSRELMELKDLLVKKTGKNGILHHDVNSNGALPDSQGNIPEFQGNQGMDTHAANEIIDNQVEHAGGVPTSPSRDSGQDSESGNDENHVTSDEIMTENSQLTSGQVLVTSEDSSGLKMDET